MGRPKGSLGRCGYCGKLGHNKTKCPVDPDNMHVCTGCDYEMHDSCFERYQPNTFTLCYVCFPEKAHACRICGGLGHNYKTCPDTGSGTFHCNGCDELLPPEEFIYQVDPMSREWKPTCSICWYKAAEERITTNPRAYLMMLLHRSRNTRFSKKNPMLHNDLDIEFLVSLLEKQKGLCYYTGLPMTTTRGHFSISLDRIDHSTSYLKGNVVLCCQLVNMMKYTMSPRQFVALCKIVLNHNAKAFPNTSVDDLRDIKGYKGVSK